MINALNINSTVGIFFEDWVEIREGETLEYDVSLYEDADTEKVGVVWVRSDSVMVVFIATILHDNSRGRIGSR